MTPPRELVEFRAGLDRPAEVQTECLLRRLIEPNRDCEFGRRHGFAAIGSVEEYRRAVPISTYEDLRPAVERMAAGERDILASGPVRHFFTTSGTTSKPKLVPVTHAFLRDKMRALAIYWQSIAQRYPDLDGGRVTTNFADCGAFGTTAAGIPKSSESAFWGRLTAATRQQSHFVPPAALSAIEDSDSRYYVLARLLLGEDLAMLMSLNPSTILLLLQKLEAFVEPLIDDLERGGLRRDLALATAQHRELTACCPARPERARAIRAGLRSESPRFQAVDLWPKLALMISWQSRVQQPYLDLLAPFVDGVAHADYPTMASEGVIALPLGDPAGAVLATGVHFYEFIPEERVGDEAAETLLAHQLEEGRAYAVLLSTSGGLYRYAIGDVLRVQGFAGATPCVEFLHRSGATCSLTGEKLTEEQVSQAVATVAQRAGLGVVSFTAQPAGEGFPRYLFLVELDRSADHATARQLLAALDRELGRRNVEYLAKRGSQRLAPPELWLVRPGSFAALRRQRVAGGANDEQIKPAVLTRDPGFHHRLEIGERIRAA